MGKKNDIMKIITDELLPLGIGAVGSKFAKPVLKKIVPTAPSWAPAALQLVGGVLLMRSKKPVMKFIGYGAASTGLGSAAGVFIPSINGIEDMDLSGIFGSDTLNDEINEEMNDDPEMAGPLNDGVGAYDENY